MVLVPVRMLVLNATPDLELTKIQCNVMNAQVAVATALCPIGARLVSQENISLTRHLVLTSVLMGNMEMIKITNVSNATHHV